jgi:hypothetical protein
MSEPEPSFETRLESMERRLADIQRELAPEPQAGREPAPEATSPGKAASAGPAPLRLLAVPGSERPGPRPAPARPEPPPPTPPPPDRPATERPGTEPTRDSPEFELLGTMYSELLASVRRLLDGYEAALRQLSQHSPTPAGDPIEITAGPFRDTEALREFQRALARLPGVREVALRGYQSGNRAILEVQLEHETS